MAILTLVPNPAESEGVPGLERRETTAPRVVGRRERALSAPDTGRRVGPGTGRVPAPRVVVAAESHRERDRGRSCVDSHEPDVHGSRLTARGRVVVALVWALMIAAGVAMVLQPGEPAAPAETSTLRVAAGDTLWELAGLVAPDADRRDTIAVIVSLNGLESAGDIHPGDVLVVPAEVAAEAGP